MADDKGKPSTGAAPRSGGSDGGGDAKPDKPMATASNESRGGGDAKGADLDTERNTGRRTGGTTEAAADEYAALGVNPRLDNRMGNQRPMASAFAAKPQQFPGPEVGHFEEHAEANRAAFEEATGEPRGMYSMGPHGRADNRLVHDAGPDGNPASASDATPPVAHDNV